MDSYTFVENALLKMSKNWDILVSKRNKLYFFSIFNNIQQANKERTSLICIMDNKLHRSFIIKTRETPMQTKRKRKEGMKR